MLTLTVTSGCTAAELRAAAAAISYLLDTGDSVVPAASATEAQIPLPLPTPVHSPVAASAPIPTAPAAPAPVPAPPIPAQTEPTNLVDLDADGMPYDARIHSEGKAKNADGRWRKRRNVPDETVAIVTSELKALVSAASPTAAPEPAPVLDPVAAFSPPATAAAPAPIPPPPPPVPAFVPPTPIPAEAGDAPTTFNELMPRIMAAMSNQKLNQASVQAACVAAGIPNLAAVAAAAQLDPTAIGRVWTEIQKAMQ